MEGSSRNVQIHCSSSSQCCRGPGVADMLSALKGCPPTETVCWSRQTVYRDSLLITRMRAPFSSHSFLFSCRSCSNTFSSRPWRRRNWPRPQHNRDQMMGSVCVALMAVMVGWCCVKINDSIIGVAWTWRKMRYINEFCITEMHFIGG